MAHRRHGIRAGWEDCHLHGFEIAGRRFEPPDEEGGDDEGAVDEDSVVLSDLVGTGSRFHYEYDFGGGWNHEVVVETVENVPQALKHAVSTGIGRVLQRTVGGVSGYQEFLRAIGDAGLPEHRQYLDWVGGRFDPEAFGLATTQAALQRRRLG